MSLLHLTFTRVIIFLNQMQTLESQFGYGSWFMCTHFTCINLTNSSNVQDWSSSVILFCNVRLPHNDSLDQISLVLIVIHDSMNKMTAA